MNDFWAMIGGLSEAQAQVVTTLMLIIGGGLGVWLGSVLYGRRVSDLKGAVEQAEQDIQSFSKTTNGQLSELKNQLDSAIDQLTRARKEITELAPEIDDDIADPRSQMPEGEAGDRDAFKSDWYLIRYELWELAFSDKIHGLRRNKYNTYTNNQIGILIDVMHNDGELTDRQAELFHEAHELFARHRNGRPFLSKADASRMSQLQVIISSSMW